MTHNHPGLGHWDVDPAFYVTSVDAGERPITEPFDPEGRTLGKTRVSTFPREESMCKEWWRIRDSNPGPADYDSVALTD